MVHNGFHAARDLSQHCEGLSTNVFKVMLGIDDASADVLGGENTKTVRRRCIEVNTHDVVQGPSITPQQFASV